MQKISLLSEEQKEILEKLINEKLTRFKIDDAFENMKSSLQEYLFRIEDTLNNVVTERAMCVEKYKNTKISRRSIAEQLGLSRQTLYNHKVIKVYLDESLKELETTDIFMGHMHDEADLEELKKIRESLAAEFVQYNKLKLEVNKLKKKLESEMADNSILQATNTSLSRENEALREKLSKLAAQNIHSMNKQQE